VFERALERARIARGDVTVRTLRHTALSRMIERGLDDHTVMSISGHSSIRMLERYTHPTVERKRTALETFDSQATNWLQNFEPRRTDKKSSEDDFPNEFWWTAGGSNSRPPRCERGALPTELAAHSVAGRDCIRPHLEVAANV
jgi:Phage integrase family